MLTFFRRIRKGLLGSGATKKYILYAFGEFILIVAGILMAMQINNWNEDQKRSNMGRLFTIQIWEDLQNDLTTLNLMVDTFKVQYDAAIAALEIVENGEVSHSELIQIRQHINSCASAVIAQRLPSTWDELRSTGQLAIIHNDSLSNFLQSFYAYYDSRVSNFNRIQASLREDFRILMSNFYKVDEFKNSILNDYQFKNQSMIIMANSSTIQQIIEEPTFPQLISSIATGTIYSIQFFSTLSSQAQSIISYMEKNYGDILHEK